MTRENPRRAAGYIRVSAVMGREGDSFMSPDVQREKIQAWADYRGFDIAAWYVDLDVSGREGVHRPEFERMMADAKAGKIDAVAVYRLTRFARSVSQAAARYRELRTLDVALVSVTEDIDTTTASGSFMQNMLFAMAEFESERIGEEWRNVHAQRRRRGIAHVARPMYGYEIHGAELGDPIADEAAGVLLAYRLRGTGASYGEIRNELERAGHTPKHGGRRFATSSLRSILGNPLYAGLVTQPDGTVLDGVHKAIVPRDLWERVQATHSHANSHAAFTGSLLSGLIVCSSCGYRMRYESRRDRPDVYLCRGRDNSEGCDHPLSIRADAADSYVEQRFLARFDPTRMPAGGKLKQGRQQEEWARRARTAAARAADLRRALDTLSDRRFVKGTLDAAEYERQSGRYLAELEAREREAAELERRFLIVTPVDTNVLSLWPSRPVEAKRRALRIQVERIELLPSKTQGGAQGRGVNAAQRLKIAWVGGASRVA